MNSKSIIIGFVCVLLGFGIGYVFLHGGQSLGGATATSTAGTTNSSSKLASVAMNPTTSAASSTGLLNTDATDRVITSTDVFCDSLGTSRTYLTGSGLSGLTLTSATSATAAQNGNSNYAANIAVSTATPSFYLSSSTEGVVANGVSRLWPTATYLVDTFNATNTAGCTVTHKYFVL